MRYYNLTPYHYRRYYNPYYNYQQNIIDSQIADINQSINNFGDMTDVIQNANNYQLRTSAPEIIPNTVTEAHEETIVSKELPEINPPELHTNMQIIIN